jgi:hypothetical protein
VNETEVEAVARAIFEGRREYMRRPDGGTLDPFDDQPHGIQDRTRAEARAVLGRWEIARHPRPSVPSNPASASVAKCST